MTQVAVLGQGQLGWMLRRAGDRLGLDVQLLAPNEPALPNEKSIITVESEHWPDNDGVRALQQHPGWRNARALDCLPDRRSQKAVLDELQLATSPWCAPDSNDGVEDLRNHLGGDFLLKRARGGYDGKGQWRAASGEDLPDWKTDAIAEAMIDFDTEVSLVGARGADGQCVFYRLTENLHRSGVLTVSLSQPERFASLQPKAEDMLSRLMTHLDYVGVMAMECFVVGDELLINELAPRVHNSGHWTQDGASICQFELHLRALLGWPMPPMAQPGMTAMVNLLGLDMSPDWLSVSGAQLYWYGKTRRPGRKMGHINLYHPDFKQIARWLEELPLPEEYGPSRDWALSRLK